MFKILVVEDDKELNKTVCSFLSHSGYESTECLNATDAYDALYETMFDLIVSDIMMPGVDGIVGDVDLNIGIDIIGDVNRDGKVNMADVTTLLKWLAGWDVNIDEGQADINRDGKVSITDEIKLLGLIAR